MLFNISNLSKVKLTRENYPSWNCDLQACLIEKGILKTITSDSQPNKENNIRAMAEITKTLNDKEKLEFIQANSAKELWNLLKQKFSQYLNADIFRAQT